MNRRTKLLAIIAAVAVGSTAVGWVAGQRIKSPADIAAETAPPEPSLITVPVERRVLSSTVITRGTVGFDEQTEIRVSASSAGDSNPIVTRLPGFRRQIDRQRLQPCGIELACPRLDVS